MLLFSPYTIKNLELKNRIVLPPLASFLIKQGGGITDATIEHYKRRAGGGPAMVVMEACAISAEGVVSANQARIDEERHLEGLSKIATAIKSEGAVPAVQILDEPVAALKRQLAVMRRDVAETQHDVTIFASSNEESCAA